MPIITAYYFKCVIGSPFKSVARLVFFSHNSYTLWKYSDLHFIHFFFSSSLFLVPLPGLILDFPVVFDFDDFNFEFSSYVELTCFFTLPLCNVVVYGLPTVFFGAFLPKKFSVQFLTTAASTFFFTCTVFFSYFLIPSASDLPIVALVIVSTLCPVPMNNPCKMKAYLQN